MSDVALAIGRGGMMKSLSITRIGLVSAYKLFFVGTFVGMILVCAVSALFDLRIVNVTIQGQELTTANVIWFAPIGALVLSPICTVLFGSSCVLGV